MKTLKILFIVVLIITSPLWLAYLFVQGSNWFLNYLLISQQRSYLEELKNDRYGGKTPEETLDLFLEALKKNDPKLAARYYYLEFRYKRKKSFEKVLSEEGSLKSTYDNVLEVKTKGNKTCRYSDMFKTDICIFSYTRILKEDTIFKAEGREDIAIKLPKGYEQKISIMLIKNPYNNIWKLGM